MASNLMLRTSTRGSRPRRNVAVASKSDVACGRLQFVNINSNNFKDSKILQSVKWYHEEYAPSGLMRSGHCFSFRPTLLFHLYKI
jgi:hypothetical protein